MLGIYAALLVLLIILLFIWSNRENAPLILGFCVTVAGGGMVYSMTELINPGAPQSKTPAGSANHSSAPIGISSALPQYEAKPRKILQS